MGIVNVTPDSFSDGGRYFSPAEAVRRARNLVREGADIIDLGGESTRPGAERLAWSVEWDRLRPVLAELQGLAAVISVDTYHPETAAAAIAAGARMINCVNPESVPAMLGILKEHPEVELVMPVAAWRRLSESERRKLRSRCYLDPMIGFGTTREEDLELLRNLDALALEGRVLVGASRKRIVKKLTGIDCTGKLTGGNVAIALLSAMKGASIVRVHEVLDTVEALKVIVAVGPLASNRGGGATG